MAAIVVVTILAAGLLGGTVSILTGARAGRSSMWGGMVVALIMLAGWTLGTRVRDRKKLDLPLWRRLTKEQAAIEATIFQAQDVNQLVTVKVNGKKELVELDLAPDLVDPDDIEMLQDLVIATVNEALKQVDQATESRLGKYTQGMNLPF